MVDFAGSGVHPLPGGSGFAVCLNAADPDPPIRRVVCCFMHITNLRRIQYPCGAPRRIFFANSGPALLYRRLSGGSAPPRRVSTVSARGR